MGAEYVQLRERARALLALRSQVTQDELLSQVYGARVPPALQNRLLAPLLADAELARSADGIWTLARRESGSFAFDQSFTALVVVATAARASRARVAGITALRLVGNAAAGRFSQIVNPGVTVPRYVLEQLGVDGHSLGTFPAFADVADELADFLADRPIVAMEVQLGWQCLTHEARRVGRVLPRCRLLDLGQLADACLGLGTKPTLGAIAQRVGVSPARLGHVDSDAGTLARVAVQLFKQFEQAPAAALPWMAPEGDGRTLPLRSGATLGAAPDQPGVYVMRDGQGDAVYIGKARRLRNRLAAYVNRPLGATRRLEGLTETVRSVDPHACGSELEALIVEDRSIRALGPRFNTQRRAHPWRTWLRLPPAASPRRRGRRQARRRLELADAPLDDDGAQYLGPFRNAAQAMSVRALGHALFGLRELRLSASDDEYEASVGDCWAFLSGSTAGGIERARRRQAAASQARDYAAGRRWQGLLAAALAYDPATQLLPADPREAQYALVRPGPAGVELFIVDRGMLLFHGVCRDGEPTDFARAALAAGTPLTEPTDVAVVRRWLGSQRPTARLLLLPDDQATAAAAIADAVAELCAHDPPLVERDQARPAGGVDALEQLSGPGDDDV